MMYDSVLKHKVKYKTQKSTVFRIFEVRYENEKNESGEVPVFIKKENETKKLNRILLK